MSLLHITHTDVTDDSRIEKQLKFLSNDKNNLVSCIFVRSSNYKSIRQIPGVKNISKSLILSNKKWVPRILRHIINMLELSIYIIFNGLKLKPSKIHAHDALVLPAATILSIIFKSTLIYDAHELESNKNGQNLVMRLGTFFIEKVCWYRINKFITVSESIQNWYFETFSRKDSEVIFNSPDIYNYKKTNYLRKYFNIDDASKVFIYIGYLSNGRGINHILNAFLDSSNKNHIVFLGAGELKDKIVEFSIIHQNIHYHKPVLHTEVVSVASSADIGLCLIENVSLSDYFSLPNKLFEYLFSGLKIIGSDFPEIKKIIADYNAGVTCKNSSIALQNAITSLNFDNKTFDYKDLGWDYQLLKLKSLYER